MLGMGSWIWGSASVAVRPLAPALPRDQAADARDVAHRQGADHARRILGRAARDVERRRERGPRRGDDVGRRGSSAITKLIVVSVVEALRFVRVEMLAVARLPAQPGPVGQHAAGDVDVAADRAVVVDEAVEDQLDRVQQSRRAEAALPTMPSAVPSVLSIAAGRTGEGGAEPPAPRRRRHRCGRRGWRRQRAPELVGGRAACRTAMPVAFSLPSMVTLMVLPNWLLPRVLRSISPSRMPVASPLKSTASAGWLGDDHARELSEPP